MPTFLPDCSSNRYRSRPVRFVCSKRARCQDICMMLTGQWWQCGECPPHSHVDSIFLITPTSVPFSIAAATRSLSPSCLLTASAVVCVPSFRRTSIRKRGGRAFSKRTRTASPMTVPKLQWAVVGVSSTVTVEMREVGVLGPVMKMSGRLTTARLASELGCSGS